MAFSKPVLSGILKAAALTVLAAAVGSAVYLSSSLSLRLTEYRIAAAAHRGSNILVMGLPRSGAEAIHEFFQCAGLTSSHYCCDATGRSHFPCEKTCGSCVHENMLHERPAFEGCGTSQVYAGFEVETDIPFGYFLPQRFALPILHESDPHAVWILNTRRDAETWAANILHWFSRTNRILNSFGVPYYTDLGDIKDTLQQEVTEETLYSELDRALQRANNETEHERRRNALIEIYKSHSDRIRRFVRHNPSHALIEVSVDDFKTPTILAKALGLEVSANCWRFNAAALDNDWKDFSLDALYR